LEEEGIAKEHIEANRKRATERNLFAICTKYQPLKNDIAFSLTLRECNGNKSAKLIDSHGKKEKKKLVKFNSCFLHCF
jgi:hypothetical protein